ncbi:hypothetical protein GCM10017691_62820 [Pseudonocardia petroleophila]|uniref:TIGR03086 family protein n=1 Tax=Pseudonocardia petroleophila TaxID=37331 RepID=A0A7G7MLV4_9PSEU|nr:TIGR03086 family protein [Pseudonocardia petroleophila]QNG53765.1 TIGR03086 family protein [Pseudonocardia petroleophila]
MIREAQLFLLADAALVDTVARVDDWDAVVPPVFDMPGADRPATVRAMVAHLSYDEGWVPAMLAGRTMDEVGRDRFDDTGADPRATLVRHADAARAAARTVTDPDAPVHCAYGDCPAWHYLWQLVIARTLSAVDLAARLDLPDPLGEELARGLHEGTAHMPEWRELGVYRTARPVPDGASWHDRYLALTGRGTLAA